MNNETLEVAREVISMLAIAVGFSDKEEYLSAIALAEDYELYKKWDEIPEKYYNEYISLIKDWNG
ncbi:MAG TPA: hypothetical protein VLA13_04545 [Massilibacterium sp.]|nr:hypothetical protein [Massilibacterium sp.]